MGWREKLAEWYMDKIDGIGAGIVGMFDNGGDLIWNLIIIAAMVGVYMDIAGFKKTGNKVILASVAAAIAVRLVTANV